MLWSTMAPGKVIVVTLTILFIMYLTFQSFSRLAPSVIYRSATRPAAGAFVITLANESQRSPIVISLFQKYANLNLSLYDAVDGRRMHPTTEDQSLTPGELGLRETIRRFFTMAVERNYTEVFLFEDDAIPHLNFSQLFNNLPIRCQEADVLMLGATIWTESEKPWPPEACFDATSSTYGAFALLVKRSAFLPILNWLQTEPGTVWDFIYRHLQQKKLIVRVAYPPFLVIADISHASSVNPNREIDKLDVRIRAAKHDWHLEDYPLFSIPTQAKVSWRLAFCFWK